MRERRHIASLDGLRGITALAVVMAHVYLVFPALGPLPLPDIGSGAVAIFFAISGFLMAYLYGDRPFSRKNAADFLVNRFARMAQILPVLPVISRSLWLLLGRRRIATPQLPVPQGWIVDILFRPSSLPLLLRMSFTPIRPGKNGRAASSLRLPS